MQHDYDAIVIGAGHNGLTSAAYMAKAGLEVAVFEKNYFVGGMSATYEFIPGYKFTTGAIYFGTMPADQRGPGTVRAGLQRSPKPSRGSCARCRREVLRRISSRTRQDLRVPGEELHQGRTPSRTASGPTLWASLNEALGP